MSELRSNKDFRGVTWAIISSISLTIGIGMGIVLVDIVDNGFPQQWYQVIIPTSGLCLGLGQWIILRRRIQNSLLWIPATALGPALGFYIGFQTTYFYFDDLSTALFASIIMGLLTGVFQWFAIKRSLKNCSSWVIVSTFCWGFATLLVIAIDKQHPNSDNGLALSIAFSSIVGIVSGIFVKPALIKYAH